MSALEIMARQRLAKSPKRGKSTISASSRARLGAAVQASLGRSGGFAGELRKLQAKSDIPRP